MTAAFRKQLAGLPKERGQHPGLILQRLLAEPASGENGNSDAKRSILLYAVNAANADKNPTLRSLYKAAYDCWQAPDYTASNVFRTDGRMIVGLGSENVLETGIRLHHTYGLPLIPGSALKGLAAHYCNEIWGTTGDKFKRPSKEQDEAYRKGGPDDNYHRLLFGNTDDSGCIIFHDAWLAPGSNEPLVLDVMTPHHRQWLDGRVAPTDFDSPVPVPFLAVQGEFRVAVSWHGPECTVASNWTTLAFELLGNWGIGGKTSSGYGRLVEINPKERKPPISLSALGLPDVGDIVWAVLVTAPKKNNPWRAKLRDGTPLAGPVRPTEKPPSGLVVGDTVQSRVEKVNVKLIEFQWN